jgi:Zn-dependent alcohol dehydrogenase
MKTIRAAVSHGIGQPLAIETIQLAPPGPGQIEVRIEACAICHSDLTYMDGGWACPFPAVFGHEAVGRVTAAGPGATTQVGARVLVTLIRACGTCRACAIGDRVHCETPWDKANGPISDMDGNKLFHAFNCAAFAEAVVVDESQTALMPEDIPAAAAATLACGGVTGMGAAVNTARVRPGETVVVIGAGGVGLNAIQGARISGAARIVAVDMVPGKLEDAKVFGATDGILATDPKPWARLREIAPRGADVVLVTVGSASAYDAAQKYLGTGGRICAVGMPHEDAVSTYSPVGFGYAGHGMKGSLMGDTVLARDIPWMVDLHAQGRLKLEEMVSKTWPLEQINEAIASTRSGAARRNVIVFG